MRRNVSRRKSWHVCIWWWVLIGPFYGRLDSSCQVLKFSRTRRHCGLLIWRSRSGSRGLWRRRLTLINGDSATCAARRNGRRPLLRLPSLLICDAILYKSIYGVNNWKDLNHPQPNRDASDLTGHRSLSSLPQSINVLTLLASWDIQFFKKT